MVVDHRRFQQHRKGLLNAALQEEGEADAVWWQKHCAHLAEPVYAERTARKDPAVTEKSTSTRAECERSLWGEPAGIGVQSHVFNVPASQISKARKEYSNS